MNPLRLGINAIWAAFRNLVVCQCAHLCIKIDFDMSKTDILSTESVNAAACI